ncbi:hypothetical protein FACS1894145_7300 [Bacteroidia bacterium]|nr:hypothetical protein FACS1894145_7300 [Bacteroidia bacterium]
MKTNILYLLLLIGFVSCDLSNQDIYIENYLINSQIVVNAAIRAENDSNFIFLSQSYPIFGDNLPGQNQNFYDGRDYYLQYFTPMGNAKLDIYKNGSSSTGIRFDMGKRAWGTDATFCTGDTVKIEVAHKLGNASASVVIPEKPIILKVNTERISASSQYYSYYNICLKIKIKSQPGKRNYYRINLIKEQEFHYTQQYIDYYGGNGIVIDNYKPSFYSEGPILNIAPDRYDMPEPIPEDIAEELLFLTSYNGLHIFNDDLFQNGEGTLVLYTNDDMVSAGWEHAVWAKSQFKISLQTLSEDLYLYYSSLQQYAQSNKTSSKPIRVHNNIQDGLGIFGAVNETEYIVFENIWQSQE